MHKFNWFGKASVLLLILILVFPSLNGVYAETSDASELLSSYGIVSGYNGDFMLDKALSRAEACVLLASLYQAKEAASQTAYEPLFSDVNEGDWYMPYVIYAAKASWVSGYSDGTFKPDQSVTKAEWSAMLLNLLGYTYTWEKVDDFAEMMGLESIYDESEVFDRGHAFETMTNALEIEPYGKSEMLGKQLGIHLASEDAVELDFNGYMTPSLRMIQFKLDQALDAEDAINPEHYLLKDSSGHYVKVLRVNYDELLNEVTLILDKPLDTNDTADLKIYNVLGADASLNKMSVAQSIVMMDVAIPYIVNVERLDSNQLVVEFSEPVSGFEVDAIGSASTMGTFDVEADRSGMFYRLTFDEPIETLYSLTLYNSVVDDYGYQVVANAYEVTDITADALAYLNERDIFDENEDEVDTNTSATWDYEDESMELDTLNSASIEYGLDESEVDTSTSASMNYDDDDDDDDDDEHESESEHEAEADDD